MNSAETVSYAWIKLVVSAIENNGQDAQKLCQEVGIDYQNLSLSNVYEPISKLNNLWRRTSEGAHQEAIGLIMGKAEMTGLVGACCYCLVSCPSLLHAAKRMFRYYRLFTNSAEYVLKKTKEGYWSIVNDLSDGHPVTEQSLVSVLAFKFTVVNWAFRHEVSPLEVHFKMSEPKDVLAYLEFFKCTIKFDQEENGILYSHDDFTKPLLSANFLIESACDREVMESIEYPEKIDFSLCVRDEIVNVLSEHNDVTMVYMAEKLKMSQSTLLRRLKDEGWTFRALLNDTRKKQAQDYLKKSISIQEVSFMLGFTETSAFFRAFKRWFACTPMEYLNKNSEKRYG